MFGQALQMIGCDQLTSMLHVINDLQPYALRYAVNR